MSRVLIHLPRSEKCRDVRQIEKCLNGLHLEIFLAVLVAVCCPLLSFFTIPYVAFVVSFPYLFVSMFFRVLSKRAVNGFDDVVSLNRMFKVLGTANLLLSLLSLMLNVVSTIKSSRWSYVSALCLYSTSLVFHIFIIVLAIKMYGLLRDEVMILSGQFLGQKRIPETHIGEQPVTSNTTTEIETSRSIKNNVREGTSSELGANLGYDKRLDSLRRAALNTPLDSSNTSSTPSSNAVPRNHESLDGKPQLSEAQHTAGPVATPGTATSPKKNIFPPILSQALSQTHQESISTDLSTNNVLKESVTERDEDNETIAQAKTGTPWLERQQESDEAAGIFPSTVVDTTSGQEQKPELTLSSIVAKGSTPIARYSELSPESDTIQP